MDEVCASRAIEYLVTHLAADLGKGRVHMSLFVGRVTTSIANVDNSLAGQVLVNGKAELGRQLSDRSVFRCW